MAEHPILEGLLDLVFPPACIACGRVLHADGYFCEDCDLEVERTPKGCARCGEPGDFPDGCPRCRKRPPAFTRAHAPFIHHGAPAKAIHQFKYEDHPELARPLAKLLVEESRLFLDGAPSAICPIPLHDARMRERKFDQAGLLAAELSRLTKRELLKDSLHRIRETKRQVGLTEADRDENVKNAFSARHVGGKNVLLLDDVFTTGATARAAARALLDAGANEVQVLTVARAYSGG